MRVRVKHVRRWLERLRHHSKVRTSLAGLVNSSKMGLGCLDNHSQLDIRTRTDQGRGMTRRRLLRQEYLETRCIPAHSSMDTVTMLLPTRVPLALGIHPRGLLIRTPLVLDSTTQHTKQL